MYDYRPQRVKSSHLSGQQRIRSGLMLSPDPLDLHLIGNVLEAALKCLTTFHQIFYVEHSGEVVFQQLEKLGFVFWQFCICKNLGSFA